MLESTWHKVTCSLLTSYFNTLPEGRGEYTRSQWSMYKRGRARRAALLAKQRASLLQRAPCNQNTRVPHDTMWVSESRKGAQAKGTSASRSTAKWTTKQLKRARQNQKRGAVRSAQQPGGESSRAAIRVKAAEWRMENFEASSKLGRAPYRYSPWLQSLGRALPGRGQSSPSVFTLRPLPRVILLYISPSAGAAWR